MYQKLKTGQRNELDDGRVVGDHNLADEATETANGDNVIDNVG
jgi:hypothetical protein